MSQTQKISTFEFEFETVPNKKRKKYLSNLLNSI